MKFGKKAFYFIVLSLVFTLFCSKTKDPENITLAKVGDHVITVRDFRLNYEFGLPHLKKDPDRKRSYLNYMIDEIILAEEGYNLGFDKNERVKDLEKDLLDELLVEEFFTDQVNNKIKVTDDEIRQAITKSKVKWKLRYWFEPSKENADNIYNAMKERGYNAVVEDILRSNPEVHLKPKDFETDYLTWLDVSEELLDAIKDIPVGEVSAPIMLDGKYFIFQISDLKREGITDYEYKDKYGSYHKILFYRKLNKESARFINEFMTPKNVVTKGDKFRKIVDAFVEWKSIDDSLRGEFFDDIKNATEKQTKLNEMKQNLDETLVTFEGGKWSCKDFIEKFKTDLVKAPVKDIRSVMNQINNEIALSVRDHFLIKEANKKKLYKKPNLQKQLKQWQDKWVYQETRDNLIKDIKVDEDRAKQYFDKYKDRYKINKDVEPKYNDFKLQAKRDATILKYQNELAKNIKELKQRIPVYINEAVLDTITTFDSKKSRWQSLQVYKRSSNRMAVPIVDPAWGL